MRKQLKNLMQFLFYDAQEYTWANFIFRSMIVTGLIIWSWYLIISGWQMTHTLIASEGFWNTFLHGVNLIFHEAGHIIFGLFTKLSDLFLGNDGDHVIGTLGGTLGQLLIPLMCTGVLLVQTRDPFGASVGLWWFGQNFLDIAPYISDARRGVLPLLGGGIGYSTPYGIHDWTYLLTEADLLLYDRVLAKTVYVSGSAIMLLALLWGVILIIKHFQDINT